VGKSVREYELKKHLDRCQQELRHMEVALDALQQKHAKLKEVAGGKLHPPKAMFLRQTVGKITGPEDAEYEVTVSVGDFTPLINSPKTGKTWSITWNQLFHLALAAGLDDPEPEVAEKSKE